MSWPLLAIFKRWFKTASEVRLEIQNIEDLDQDKKEQLMEMYRILCKTDECAVFPDYCGALLVLAVPLILRDRMPDDFFWVFVIMLLLWFLGRFASQAVYFNRQRDKLDLDLKKNVVSIPDVKNILLPVLDKTDKPMALRLQKIFKES